MVLLATGGGTTAGAAVLPVPEVDVQLTAQVRSGPPAEGVTLADELRYRMTVVNGGEQTIPVGGVLVIAGVNHGAGGRSQIDVTALNGGSFGTGAAACSVGVRSGVQCLNNTPIAPGQSIRLTMAYRHTVVEVDSVAFVATVGTTEGAVVDTTPGNNVFNGGGYRFVGQQPTTTTTVEETTTTLEETTTTVEETTTTLEETTTTVEETTTTEEEPTTTTVVQTTTEAPATTAPPTTAAPTTATTAPPPTTAEVLPNPETRVDPANESDVLAATGDAGDGVDQGQALGPTAQEPAGSSRNLLFGLGLAALALGLAGAGAVYYLYYREDDPPLVDIRQYR
ncbi:MAG: hypothetical protein AAF547_14590 [Actinomycetota bacterium]